MCCISRVIDDVHIIQGMIRSNKKLIRALALLTMDESECGCCESFQIVC